MWLEKNKVFVLRNFPLQDTVSGSPDVYEKEIFNIIESSFSTISLFKDPAEGLVEVSARVFSSDQIIYFNDVATPVSFGDCVVVVDPKSYDFLSNNKFIYDFVFYASLTKVPVGNGSHEFEVICTITDKYKLTVLANSQEEAIQIANSTYPSKWEHLDIDPELEQRYMMRMARWGNYDVRKL